MTYEKEAINFLRELSMVMSDPDVDDNDDVAVAGLLLRIALFLRAYDEKDVTQT